MVVFKKILRILLKIILWVLCLFVLVFGLVWMILKVPKVQNYLVAQATGFVSKKTHTRVELRNIDIGFPKSILLQELYLDDLKKDTLLYVKELEVDIDMLALLQKKVDVNYIGLEGLNGNLIRTREDGTFNFQFLMDAFTQKEKEKVKVEDTTSSHWAIAARKFELKDCKFSLQDSVGGVFLQTSVPALLVTIDKLDLKEKSVEVIDLVVSDVFVKFTKGSSIIPDTSKPGKNPWNDIKIENLEVNNTRFLYSDDISKSGISTKVGHLKLENANLDLFEQTVRADNFFLANSDGTFALKKETSQTDKKDVTKTTYKPWLVEIPNVKLDSNNFKLDYFNVPHTKEGIDYNHLSIKDFSAEIKDVFYHGTTIKSNVRKLEFQEQSGLGIRSMAALFEMDSVHTSISDFELVTNNSRLGHKITASYSSLNKIVENGKVLISLRDNVLSVKDLLIFAPQLAKNKFFAKHTKRSLKLDMLAEGSVKNLLLKKFYLSTGNHTVIDMTGQLANVTKPEKLKMNVNLKKFQSGNVDLKLLLPDGLIPASISIPPSFIVSGRHSGTIETFISDLKLKTSYGNALVYADIKNVRSKSPGYSIRLITKDFYVGKVLNNPALGPLTGKFTAKGTGFDKNTAVAQVNAKINSIYLQNYTYRNIDLEANYNKGLADITTEINDTNLALTLSAKANVKKDQEEINFALKLKGIDLYGMQYTKDHIQVSAMVNGDFKGITKDNIRGDLAVRNIIVIKKNKEYRLDSMMIASINEPGLSSMKMSSSLMSAEVNGNLNIFSVVSTIESHLNNYFKFSPGKPKPERPQNFNFEVKINEDPFVREVLLPSLNDYRPVTIKGGFNSQTDSISFSLDAPFIEYGTYKVKSLAVNLASNKDNLRYNMGLGSFINGSMQLNPTQLSGDIANNKASINLTVANKTAGNKLSLQSNLEKKGEYYSYSILPDGLSISDQKWNVSPDNYIEFGKQRLYLHHLILNNTDQFIEASSTENSLKSDLLLNIKNFRIGTISQVFEKSDSLVQGTANGNIVLKNYQQKPAFTSDIKISDLHYKSSRVGDLNIQANNIDSDNYNIQALLSGMGNDVVLKGHYNPNDKANALDFSANIKTLQLASFDAFTGGEIRRSSGTINGNFTVKGSPSEPLIDGKINFTEARTNVRYLNQTLYMRSESIAFSETGIHFDAFNILDSLNNMATIKGDVKMKHFKDVQFDLHIVTGDFLVLNTTPVQNKLYYGKVILDSDIKIKGTPDLPKITAEITVSKGSRFTFAVPESKLSVDRGEGVIVFLYDPEDMHPIMLRREKRMTKAQALKGLDLTAHIKVRPSSTFKVLVDPVSGDSLVVKGNADINFALDPSGKMSLSGIYTISEGKYKAFIEGITSKEFMLVRGSKIVWSGDPMDALVDVQAQYNIKTSARELMSIGGSGTASSEAADLARPLGFEVLLNMEGELLRPSLSFGLDMAEQDKTAASGAVYAKLNEINSNEAELNKQVFSLLVLNKFLSSSAPGGGTSASGFARSSVSRMMSDQLNQLSSQYLKGVELNVDFQSYDFNQGGTTKSNTQANVSVKKDFDRLSVQVGSNVMLEGAAARQSNSSAATGNVEVGYKLTKDGRYKAKAFRQNQVDGIASGIITETGVGIIYSRDYNKTKDLLSPPKKTNEGK